MSRVTKELGIPKSPVAVGIRSRLSSLKADSKIVHLICSEWLLSTSSFLQSVLICPYFIASMLIGFLAWLELLLESGPPGPKRVPHGRPVKQTNKQIKQT